MKRIISLVLCFLLTFTLCQPVLAAGSTIIWTGSASDGSWHTFGNWNPAQVPVDGDHVIIPESSVVEYVYDDTSVSLDCAGALTVSGGALSLTNGNSSLTGGKLDGAGDITITSDSNLLWSGGSIEGNGTFIVNSGAQLNIDTTSDVVLSRPLVNNGQIMINSGTLCLTGGSGGTGTFTVSDDAYLEFMQGAYSIGGDFVNGGNLSIWDTSSALFNAGYRQENTGNLALKVWGSGSDEYCKLDVSGEAELGGVLEIDFIADYTPQPGDTFEIMTCGSRTGEFSSITNNMEGDGITLVPAYTDTGLTLKAATVWEVANATELETALNDFQSDDTIKLTADFTYNKGIAIDGKNVTFDTNSFILNVYSSADYASGIGLEVKNGGNVYLIGSGQLYIRQIEGNTAYGVKATDGSTAMVTNVQVTVYEDDAAVGAYADGTGSSIQVLGNVHVMGVGGCGAKTVGRGSISVDGTITATIYINIGSTYKDISSGVDDPEKPGYLKYCTDPVTGIVWVKAASVTVPATPQNFTATPGDTQVALSWTAPESDGGAVISGYEVSGDNGSTWITASTSTSHTFTGLTNGTEYTFKVRAVNSEGNGAEASAAATPTAPAPTQPGQLYTWGNNVHGQLGDGTIGIAQNKSTPTHIGTAEDWTTVSAGDQHTVALKSDGSLWTWGDNNEGRLGDGTSEFRKDSPVRIGSDNDWAAVEAGDNHTVALKTDGSLWAWGGNNIGQLGDDTTENRNVPTLIDDGSTWIAVSAGFHHTVALKADGSLWAWGDNSKGQLGDGGTVYKTVPTQISTEEWAAVSAGTKFTVALKADGSLWTWGWNDVGQLGDGTIVNKNVPTQVGSDTWLAAAAGDNHVVAIKADGSLWAWGGNEYGELGNGSSDGVSDPTPHSVPAQIGTATDWIFVSTSDAHNAAFKTDGSLWLWGLNGSGQLGDNSIVSKLTPQRLDGAGTWLAIACGGSHTVATLEATPTAPEFAGGDGSEEEPYLIATVGQLNNVRNYLGTGHNDKHFKLSANLNLDVDPYDSDNGWEPIGDDSTPFTGNFDGDGRSISNLFINRPTTDYVGLFGYTGAEAEILGLGLTGVQVVGSDCVGGMVGKNYGDISESYVTGTVTGKLHVGGLVGYNENGRIDKSYATGTVTGTETGIYYTYVGGLVGSNIGPISDSYARGAVSGQENVGGLVGYNQDSITNSYATGAVTGDSYIGGLVGFNNSDDILLGSYWDTEATGQDDSDGGTGKSTAEMKEQATYEGWDFDDVWGINGSDNNGYPFLRWQGYEHGQTNAPDAPQNFTTAPGSGQVVLSWTAPASDGGSAITKYQVSKDNGENWTDVGLNTSHTFTGLTNGTEYTFKVRAVNSVGNGAEASAAATPSEFVCEIGETEYSTLDDALATLVDNTLTTITLLQDITDIDGISLSRKNLTIDLNGKILTVNNSAGIGIEMNLRSEINIIGPGNLNVHAGMAGLSLNQSIFAAPENVMVDIKSDNRVGLYTDTECSVSLHGDVSGATGGISASYMNTITVNGTVTSTGTSSGNHAVRLTNRDNTVQVGNVIVSGGSGSGVYIETSAGGTVTVGSPETPAQIIGKGSGLWVRSDAVVTVYGDVEGSTDGINSYENSTITIHGNVKSTADNGERYGINCFANSDPAHIVVNGNVEGVNGVYIHGGQSVLNVNGNVTAIGTDPTTNFGAYTSYAKLNISGNLTASNCLGAHSFESSEITVDGTITAQNYIKVKYTEKTMIETDATSSRDGYLQYSDGNNAFVWVKAAPSTPTVPAAPQNFTAIPGDGQVVLSWTAPVSDGGATISRYEVSDDNGATWVTANTSTSYTFTGLTNGTEYTFKVRAVNSVGNGAEASAAATPSAPAHTTHTVSFYSGSSLYASKTVTSGSALGTNWPDNPTRSRYSFGGWFTGQNGAGTQYTSYTIVNADVDLYAKWTYDDDDSDNGGRRTPTTPTTPEYKADVKAGSGTETTLPVTVDKDAGTASIYTGSRNLNQGGTVITIPSIPDVDTYSVGIPVPDLSTTDIQATLTLNTDTGSITVTSNMLTGVEGTKGNKAQITIGQADKSNLPEDVKSAVGDRPLVQLTLSIDGKQTNWNNPEASVTVSIPYNPTAAELADPEHIVVWYIDGAGNAISVPNGRYDPETGTVIFTTTHFSYYAIAYVHQTFEDLESVDWAKESIEVLASKGILKGISETKYAPQTNITRADFMYFLIRTMGVDSKFEKNFDDIDKNAYYYKEMGIAKKLGIASGTGNNRFSPNESITRQDMMVLTERALRMLKKLEVQGTVSDLEKFSDQSLIGDYAIDSVASLIKEGLIVGNIDKVNPLGNTTRAEAAVFLYRVYIKY